jgi:hypothetical protein
VKREGQPNALLDLLGCKRTMGCIEGVACMQ